MTNKNYLSKTIQTAAITASMLGYSTQAQAGNSTDEILKALNGAFKVQYTEKISMQEDGVFTYRVNGPNDEIYLLIVPRVPGKFPKGFDEKGTNPITLKTAKGENYTLELQVISQTGISTYKNVGVDKDLEYFTAEDGEVITPNHIKYRGAFDVVQESFNNILGYLTSRLKADTSDYVKRQKDMKEETARAKAAADAKAREEKQLADAQAKKQEQERLEEARKALQAKLPPVPIIK